MPKVDTHMPADQTGAILAVRAALKGPARYHIVTLGCQMNVRDSQTIAGFLEAMGFEHCDARDEADLILYNTCCVRENAENRALGNVIWLKELKADRPNLIIAVAGCMMQEEGMAERIRTMYPFIDLAFGTHNMHRLPELLRPVVEARRRVIEVVQSDGAIHEDLPVVRGAGHSAFITVMYGCDNFCSYCIVPYVRGRERSRAMDRILKEAEGLLETGVQEITLLGQNVNSYGGGGDAFAELLRRLDAMGVPRIRFMTSHPKDISDALIACYADLSRLAKQLHLPIQAGSDRILLEMNRRYTREGYLKTVEALRRVCPDLGLTTDIIVGFPGETAAEFEDTLSLVEAVRFDAAFTFIYSPRAGTKAADMPDDTPGGEKSARMQRLIDTQARITGEILTAQIGRRELVITEGTSARDLSKMSGRTDRGHMVNFLKNGAEPGDMVPVLITSAGRNTLRGERVI